MSGFARDYTGDEEKLLQDLGEEKLQWDSDAPEGNSQWRLISVPRSAPGKAGVFRVAETEQGIVLSFKAGTWDDEVVMGDETTWKVDSPALGTASGIDEAGGESARIRELTRRLRRLDLGLRQATAEMVLDLYVEDRRLWWIEHTDGRARRGWYVINPIIMMHLELEGEQHLVLDRDYLQVVSLLRILVMATGESLDEFSLSPVLSR